MKIKMNIFFIIQAEKIMKFFFRNWYFLSNLNPEKAVNLINCSIKYQDCIGCNWGTKLNINQEKIEWISFNCLPVAFTKFELIKLYNEINLNKKTIQFDLRILKKAYYQMARNAEIQFFNQTVKMSKKFRAEVQYKKKTICQT